MNKDLHKSMDNLLHALCTDVPIVPGGEQFLNLHDFSVVPPFSKGSLSFSLQELLKDIKGTILSTRIEAGVSAQLTPESQSFLFGQVLCFNLLVNFLDDFFVACRPDTADFHNQLGLCFFLLAAHDVGPLWLSCIGDAQLHPWPLSCHF